MALGPINFRKLCAVILSLIMVVSLAFYGISGLGLMTTAEGEEIVALEEELPFESE